MRGYKVASAALGLIIGVLAAAPASAWNRGNVQVLTVLPDLKNQPGIKSSVEGLTVGLDGNIYVPSFGFNTTKPGTPGAISGPANLFVISPNGKIVNQFIITCTNCPPNTPSSSMLGLRFNPVNQHLWVLDFFAGLVLDVRPDTGQSTLLAGPIAGSALNALTFDKSGNGYVSDSFNGVIWKVPLSGGATQWSNDPLLGPGTPFGSLTPPFGANGVEFSNDGSTLFVANTAFHQIIQIPVNSNGTAGTASIFITGINAPDGIAIDSNDNIWICANQEDEIVVIDKTGKVIAKLGDFGGIDPKGIVRGFLFPASLAFSNDKSILYVSNLTLFLPFAGAHAAIDSASEMARRERLHL